MGIDRMGYLDRDRTYSLRSIKKVIRNFEKSQGVPGFFLIKSLYDVPVSPSFFEKHNNKAGSGLLKRKG